MSAQATPERRAEFLRMVGRHLRKQEGWWDDPEWADVASDMWCALEDGTVPTPPPSPQPDHAELVERLREENEVLARASADAERFIDDLRAWKASAATELGKWHEVFDALGRPGALGGSMAAASLAEVRRLLAGGHGPQPDEGREWHCEGDAVGYVWAGTCSPEGPIHGEPCGWRSIPSGGA